MYIRKQALPVTIMLSIIVMLQACVGMKIETPPAAAETEIRDIDLSVDKVEIQPNATSTGIPITSTPVLKITPTNTGVPEIRITAVNGNLFIRRGPDLAFNPVAVLYEGNSAIVIAQDVLSDWVQIEIPGSAGTGWVSIQTKYSEVTGSLDSLPGITSTDWPVAAYLQNCTYHEMYILPGEIILPSYFEYPENEVWLYPGSYTVYDLDVADEPSVLDVDMREGVDIEITVDGLGEKRKCP